MKTVMKKDMKIIGILKENCRTSSKNISMRTGIPITTVCSRIKHLEKNGVISRYTAVIDNRKIGNGIEAFVRIDVNGNPEPLIKSIMNRPEVEECYVVTGSIEVVAKVAMPGVEELNAFVSSLKSRCIRKINTQVILRNVEKKQSNKWIAGV